MLSVRAIHQRFRLTTQQYILGTSVGQSRISRPLGARVCPSECVLRVVYTGDEDQLVFPGSSCIRPPLHGEYCPPHSACSLFLFFLWRSSACYETTCTSLAMRTGRPTSRVGAPLALPPVRGHPSDPGPEVSVLLERGPVEKLFLVVWTALPWLRRYLRYPSLARIQAAVDNDHVAAVSALHSRDSVVPREGIGAPLLSSRGHLEDCRRHCLF